jgi:hypothetical protein
MDYIRGLITTFKRFNILDNNLVMSSIANSMLKKVLTSKMPNEITLRLKSLNKDIIHVLLDSENQPNLHSLVPYLPNNLNEITQYYFTRGGKLLRPTVSFLMSDICNESMLNSK